MTETNPDAHPRMVTRGAFAVDPTCLGFGCASLGSRVGGGAGFRALVAAYEAGVTWFDVAPAYGAGEAESLLSNFLQGRRDRLILTSKVGIAPPARLGVMKLAYALGRPVVGRAAGLRKAFRQLPSTRNRRMPLDAAMVEQGILGSLARLRTDHVDVYALHDPDPADVVRDDILRALERVVARGQARSIAVAGKLDACRAALRSEGVYSLLQMSVEDFAAAGDAFAGAPHRIVLHSVFGVDGMRERLARTLAAVPDHARRVVNAGYDVDVVRAASQLLLDNAFALNPDGTILASMFGAGHLEANLSRARRPVSPDAPTLLKEILA